MKLPEGFTLRGATPDDAQAVTDLLCLCDIEEFGEPDYSVDDLRTDWGRSELQLERDVFLIHAPDRSLVGYSFVWDRPRYTSIDPTTSVHPNYHGQGLEEFLLDRSEMWAREFSQTQPPILQFIVNARNPAKVARLTGRGYSVIRHDWVMDIEMKEPPPQPIVPEAIALRPFERGRDERQVWATIQETFLDVWGHTEDFPFEQWSAWLMEHPDWKPELSFLAQDGDEIAAASMCFHFSSGGWVRQLGVRRPWRKRGIALALLHRIFGGFYARRVKRVGLSVDSESFTGAQRLYERAGMHVKNHFSRFEKKLVGAPTP